MNSLFLRPAVLEALRSGGSLRRRDGSGAPSAPWGSGESSSRLMDCIMLPYISVVEGTKGEDSCSRGL
ncbi:hypothetical protein EYF80_051965 [Liparis tanakae]|uniref:Uncharacterized protein n=1 Tax=Liparis tanakae TaxID=230148 RepID=A0A4Z2FAF9_9TELE|nr:hypothetical protein EYF80_051965 [Liparis tanakae]